MLDVRWIPTFFRLDCETSNLTQVPWPFNPEWHWYKIQRQLISQTRIIRLIRLVYKIDGLSGELICQLYQALLATEAVFASLMGLEREIRHKMNRIQKNTEISHSVKQRFICEQEWRADLRWLARTPDCFRLLWPQDHWVCLWVVWALIKMV